MKLRAAKQQRHESLIADHSLVPDYIRQVARRLQKVCYENLT